MTKSSKPAHELKPNWWQSAVTSAALLKEFKGFVVGLFLRGNVTGKPEEHYFYTGFLLEVDGAIYWATAGHVIENLQAVLTSSNFSVSFMRWLDGYETPGAEGVVVNHASMRMRSWQNDGFDFGAVELPMLERDALMANEDVRLAASNLWQGLDVSSPDGYYVLGFPRQWNDLSQRPLPEKRILNSFKADLASLPLEKIEARSDDAHSEFWRHEHSFYGRLLKFSDLPQIHVENIEAMSGGPILSVEQDEKKEIGIRLVGIQADWLPDSRVVRAEPILTVVDELRKWK